LPGRQAPAETAPAHVARRGSRSFQAEAFRHSQGIPEQDHGRTPQTAPERWQRRQRQVGEHLDGRLDESQEREQTGRARPAVLAEEAPERAVELDLAPGIEAPGRGALVVDELDHGQVPDLIAMVYGPFAQVGLFQIEEEALVQGADCIEHGPPQEHAGPDHRRHLDRTLEPGAFARVGPGQEDLEQGLVDELVGQGGDDIDRVLVPAVREDELHPADACLRVLFHEGRHGRDDIRGKEGIRVEQQDPFAFGSGDAFVDRPGET